MAPKNEVKVRKVVNTTARVLFLDNAVRLVPGEPTDVDVEILDHKDHVQLFERGDLVDYTAAKGKGKKAAKQPEEPNPNPSTGGDA